MTIRVAVFADQRQGTRPDGKPYAVRLTGLCQEARRLRDRTVETLPVRWIQ